MPITSQTTSASERATQGRHMYLICKDTVARHRLGYHRGHSDGTAAPLQGPDRKAFPGS